MTSLQKTNRRNFLIGASAAAVSGCGEDIKARRLDSELRKLLVFSNTLKSMD